MTWFVTTYKRFGEITVLTTGVPRNAISGTIVSWLGGLFLAVVLTFLFPWQLSSTDPEHVAYSEKIYGMSNQEGETISNAAQSTDAEGEIIYESKNEAKVATATARTTAEAPALAVATGNDVVDFLTYNHIKPLNGKSYRMTLRLALAANAFVLPVILAIPLSFGADYIASRQFFTGYIVVSFGWVWGTLAICVMWPIFESRAQIWAIIKGLSKGATGKKE